MVYNVLRLKLNTKSIYDVFDILNATFDLQNVIDFEESNVDYHIDYDEFLTPNYVVDSAELHFIIFKPESKLKLVQDSNRVFYIEYILVQLDYDEEHCFIEANDQLEGVKKLVNVRHNCFDCKNEQIFNLLYNDFGNEYIITVPKE